MEKQQPSPKWTSDDTILFNEILADPVNNFMETREKRGLKKRLHMKQLIPSLLNLKKAQKILSSRIKNSKNFKAKKKDTKLVVEMKPLQIKCNNLKHQWRKITDKKTSGSGLAFNEDPEWLKIVNPILSYTKKGQTLYVLTRLIHHSYYTKTKKKIPRKKQNKKRREQTSRIQKGLTTKTLSKKCHLIRPL